MRDRSSGSFGCVTGHRVHLDAGIRQRRGSRAGSAQRDICGGIPESDSVTSSSPPAAGDAA
eukprot:6142225-Prymnesium_polylepis.1